MSSISRPPRFPAHVLVVDDEPDLREAMAETLRDEGYFVDEAGNGAVALERALAHKPDVVVFDYAMPVADGPTMVEQLRTMIRPCPVFVGISAATAAREWCADHGVPIFLLKPFEDTTLCRAVDTAVSALMEARQPRKPSPSGVRVATRPACVVAVGAIEGDEGIREALPASLRHARIVVVDSPEEAEHVLQLIVPDLIILDDDVAHDALRSVAMARAIPVLTKLLKMSVRMPANQPVPAIDDAVTEPAKGEG